jgi:hypothetical protein
MRIAFAILAHQNPSRVVELARALAAHGDAVVLHYDANSAIAEYEAVREELSGAGCVLFAERARCGWGEFSLVQATLNCLDRLRTSRTAVDYVYLLSGADLPLRPLSDLRRFLRDNVGAEFIESFFIREHRWVRGGDQWERFLYRFPFNKRRQRRLFRAFLLLQRALRLGKKVPAGLDLCLGSQFWCLTWRSCEAILDLCRDRPDVVHFFRTAWIPDESFFQTLIRNVAAPERIRTSSLTHYEFDATGRPREYTDGDRHLLERTGAFFARKVAADAGGLRRHFLTLATSGSGGGAKAVPQPPFSV